MDNETRRLREGIVKECDSTLDRLEYILSKHIEEGVPAEEIEEEQDFIKFISSLRQTYVDLLRSEQ
jgi:hypothetical protein